MNLKKQNYKYIDIKNKETIKIDKEIDNEKSNEV